MKTTLNHLAVHPRMQRQCLVKPKGADLVVSLIAAAASKCGGKNPLSDWRQEVAQHQKEGPDIPHPSAEQLRGRSAL